MSSKTHNTHYGASMSPDQMHDWAKNAAKQIRILQESDLFAGTSDQRSSIQA